MKRTKYCGHLQESDIGQTMTVMGWAQSKRDMGGVIFVDLRDREGIVQVVFDLGLLNAKDFATADRLKNEAVLCVSGTVRTRSKETRNPKLATGMVELAAQSVEVLSEPSPLPFPLEDADNVREELRLKYRFLDLRRPKLFNNLRLRHRVVRAAESFLDQAGFLQIETPMLTKSTPEGARDYLVPSRVHPGKFYALPQSPQIFKQLLMVGGADRYYQIARCFRDEDLRADRQPEFTQVDMELSFVEQEDILQHLEELFRFIFREIMELELPLPFPRLTWHQAMDKYGSDKPDLRFGLPIADLTDLAQGCGFSVFRKAVEQEGFVRAINVKGCAKFTRGTIEELTKAAFGFGAKGMAWIAVKENGEAYSILTKYFTGNEMNALLHRMNATPGDFILFCADNYQTVCRTLGGLRLLLADLLGLRIKNDFAFAIVTDFPQFEYSKEEERWMAMHHPFTMPYEEDLPFLQSDPKRVRAQAYDVVLNGVELGSGSIRIHRPEVQQKMFEALGFTKEQAEERFGFFIQAFHYGVPPHGGFAFGLDRLVMQMAGADSLRDVIAFPKNKDAVCPMTEAPGIVDDLQLRVLGLDILLQKDNELENLKMKNNDIIIDLDSIANLSMLSLDQKEKEAMEQELSKIVGFVNQLQQIDTTGVVQTNHVIPLKNVFRTDEVCFPLEREALLENAPKKSDGYIFVPQIME